MKKDWDHSGVSTGTRQKQEAAKVRNGVSVGQLRALKESPNVVGDKPVTEVIDDGIAVIAGITDDMFEETEGPLTKTTGVRFEILW